MPQAEYSTPSRADQVWRHLSGLFGAEALKRKFGSRPPAEWDGALRSLSDAQIANGVGQLLSSGAVHLPSLPEFLAYCRQAREFEDRSEFQRLDAPQFTAWEFEGNLHLLDHVKRCAEKKQYFDAAATKILLEHKRAWVDDMEVADMGKGVPIEQQKAAWVDVMEAAMKRITTTDKALKVPVRLHEKSKGRTLRSWECWQGESQL